MRGQSPRGTGGFFHRCQGASAEERRCRRRRRCGHIVRYQAARRGHVVTLFDSAPKIGGQLQLAAKVPGKADYGRAITGFRNQLNELGVELRLGRPITKEALEKQNFDEIVIAVGVNPRRLDLPGDEDPRVVGYTEIVQGKRKAGANVAIIGGGGIGHDVAIFLAHGDDHDETSVQRFEDRWGIKGAPSPRRAARNITMLKRSSGLFGRTLGKSTGWIVRQELRDFGVKYMAGVTYEAINDCRSPRQRRRRAATDRGRYHCGLRSDRTPAGHWPTN